MARRDGALRAVTWEQAIGQAAAAIGEAVAQHGPDSVALLASPQMTNEELFLLRGLFRDRLGVERIEYRLPPGGPVYSDDFLVTANKNPNARGAEALGFGEAEATSCCAPAPKGRCGCCTSATTT